MRWNLCRRFGPWILIWSPFWACSPSAPELPEAKQWLPESPPNVLLICIDTLRADAVDGGPNAAPTPHLDALKASGLVADQAWACSNQTVPGHVGVLTGLAASRHGVRSNLEVFPDRVESLAERFQRAGWQTAGVITNALLRPEAGWKRGFDQYLDHSDQVHDSKGLVAGGRPAAEVVNQAAHQLLQEFATKDQPWFLFLHYLDPHVPYGAPAPFAGSQGGDPQALASRYRRHLLADPIAPISQTLVRLVAADLPRGRGEARQAVRNLHNLYLEEVAYLDDKIGELLSWVQQGDRPPVILFTADHGEQFGEHQRMLHATSLYEPAIRIPMILHVPGGPQGFRLSAPVFQRDVAPTLLALAGLPWQDLDGRPMFQIDTGRDHLAGDAHWLSFYWGKWKAIARRDASGPQLMELYDLEQDPQEEHNLLADQEAPQALVEALQRVLAQDQHRRPGPLGDRHKKILQDLGYVEEE
ncbi:MAG: hypothetical protein DWQ01_17550 [Planctomycetota bacterium]|nr:MAG: hypothetical protein DWQ01_17550 [Planctomycetota bacterium]